MSPTPPDRDSSHSSRRRSGCKLPTVTDMSMLVTFQLQPPTSKGSRGDYRGAPPPRPLLDMWRAKKGPTCPQACCTQCVLAAQKTHAAPCQCTSLQSTTLLLVLPLPFLEGVDAVAPALRQAACPPPPLPPNLHSILQAGITSILSWPGF